MHVSGLLVDLALKICEGQRCRPSLLMLWYYKSIGVVALLTSLSYQVSHTIIFLDLFLVEGPRFSFVVVVAIDKEAYYHLPSLVFQVEAPVIHISWHLPNDVDWLGLMYAPHFPSC